ncbi:Stk1 family PASTA domain-containing Ser/Thr kinase [Bacillus horti]|uniref:non-specific serine/threonine protein kinase n=1 Tax=Caldalkalibacillus horti TaxID=77523 RepID=A0ABT9VXI4_9BACI|nr:Stk1 family PASTA domain-containing Ser/Thr kinase [Bacillus horti]MDQ0165703.1 serine/threonine-protein kinase [Bacillus horti]
MIGKKIAGRYEILDRVGGGGMAVVYKAKDVWLDRVVALKVLRPQYAIDDDFVHRFRREAQAAASLSHPNIVSIYDVGIEEDIHYIVMEYVEGSTLKEYINNHTTLSAYEAIQITRQIAEALDHAHHNRIIHRDIKPHNILIGKNLRVKVTDFGIARAVTSATITHTGSVMGSVHYFSPEQARGGVTGEKSDIYSLGIVLYEMLTGKLPFGGDSPISVALKHLQETYTEPKLLNENIPQSVENIIIRSLAKDPTYRYASARELMKDLDTCLNDERQSERKLVIDESIYDEEATKVIPAISDDMFDTKVAPNRKEEPKNEIVEDDELDEYEDEEDSKPKKKRSIWLKVGIILAILLLLGVGVYQGANYVLGLFYVPEKEVEEVVGLPLEEAEEILEEQGFVVNSTQTTHHTEIEEGHVVSQTPTPGTSIKEGTTVRLTVSLGPELHTMRDFSGYLRSTAEDFLIDRLNFADVEVIEEDHDSVQAGHVIRHEPDIGEEVIPEETTVTLYVSKGKSKFPMPNLIGSTKDEAVALLEQNNLVLDEAVEEFSDAPEGQVYRQGPVDPNMEVAEGTPIKIWISKGYEEVYQDRTHTLNIELEENEVARIIIHVDDENGADRTVVDEHIHESKEYSIDVRVSREKQAAIRVFKNGEQIQETIRIPFDTGE